MVPRCIFFSQYIAHDPSCSSHITVIVRAAKPQSQKQLWDYLSHLLVWHVVVDVVATMEVVVKASLENERRMKFGAQEHKNCCNSGWASCQQWETSRGRSDLVMALQTVKFLLHLHFAEIEIHPDAIHQKLQIQQETWIDSAQFIPSLLKATRNETKLLPWIFTLVLFVCLCSQKSYMYLADWDRCGEQRVRDHPCPRAK